MVEVISEYEQLRLKNIERNQSFLSSIGLNEVKPHIEPKNSASTGRRRAAKYHVDYSSLPVEMQPELRRSGRVANIPQKSYVEVSFPAPKHAYAVIVNEDDGHEEKQPTKKSKPSNYTTATPSVDSSRSKVANVDVFLTDDSIGTLLDAPTKESIVRLAAPGAKFSKYSGTFSS